MKKGVLSVLMAFIMTIAMMPAEAVTAFAADGDVDTVGVEYIESVWNGESISSTKEICTEYRLVSSMSDSGEVTLESGWWVLDQDVTFSNRITMSGDVHLILKDGKTLTTKGGIYVPEGSILNVYTEGADTGAVVSEPDSGAGIGGVEDAKAGTIIIKGGDIRLKGAKGSAALGGAADDESGFEGIEIYGGNVSAYSGQEAAAIGGGEDNDQAGEIKIYGGNVQAVGHRGAGIGGGYKAAAGPISIFGGVIFAEVRIGYKIGGAAIGSGGEVNSQVINISGGRVIADGAESGGAGIGAGYDGDSGEINISGDDTQVFAYGGNMGGAGIGAGYAGDQIGTITIDGGHVEAYGNDTEGNGGGAGIGGGRESSFILSNDGGAAATININGGRVIAGTTRSGEKDLTSRPIGSGKDDDECGQLNIYGTAKVTAGAKKSTAALQSKGDRVSSIQQESANWAKIEPCDHSSADYALNDEEKHTLTCKYCDYTGTEKHHFENDACSKCGYDGYTISFDKGDKGRGTMESVKALPGEYTLPECRFTTDPQFGIQYFKNWEVLVDGEVKGTGRPGETINITTDTVLTAVWDESPDFFKVSVDKDVKNGSFSVQEEGALVKAGDDVHVTVQPDENYRLKKLVYTKSDGTEKDLTGDVSENVCTFLMPDGDITISGRFVHESGYVLTIHFSSVDGDDLADPIVIEDIAPETSIDAALAGKGMSYDSEDLFEKDGYKGTGYCTPKPITEYRTRTLFNEATVSGGKKINDDTDLYYAMNKLYDEVEVSIDPPKCTEETSTDQETGSWDWSRVVNPPKEVISEGAGYSIYRGEDDCLKRWCTDDEGNDAFEGTFTADSSYKARLYLESKLGYDFTDNASLIINGAEALNIDRHDTYYGSAVIGGTGTVVAVHDWDEPSYEWDGNYSSAKASRYCKNQNHNKSELESKPSSSEITKDPTDTEKGETTYTVVFDNKAFETQTKTVANVPKTISKVELTLAVPVCGEEIAVNPPEVTIPEDAGYQSYNTASWNDATGESESFEGGSDYTAALRIEPKIDYAFTDDVKVYVNGELLDSGAVSRELDRLVISASVTAVHDLEIHHEGKEPTCVDAGEAPYYECSACHRWFWSINSRYEIDDQGEIVLSPYGHDYKEVEGTAAEATCEKAGRQADKKCERCGAEMAGEEIPALGHEWGEWTEIDDEQHQRVCSRDETHVDVAAHNWDNGTVTTEPTATEDGVKTYTCADCGAAKTEVIPAKGSEPDTQPAPETKPTPPSPAPSPAAAPGSDPNQKGIDGTPVGPGASAAAADHAITHMPNDNDPAGSVFGKLKAKSTKQTKNSVNVKWSKVSGAAKYVIYGNACGTKNKMKKLATSTGKSKTFKKIAGKKVKKGTYYKFIIVALDSNNNVVSTSKVVHVATKGGKVGNHKSVTVRKSVTTKAKKLKKGKSLKLKAKAVKASKLKVKKHVSVRYESSNPKIATVSKKGVVKGKNKGSCYVYAYAQNGVAKKIKVSVR